MLRPQQLWWMVCGLALCFVSPNLAQAQRGGGGMGMLQYARFQLATLPEVQADLKLTDDQKKLAKTQSDKLAEKRSSLQGGPFDPAARAEMTKFTSDLDAEFVAKLDEGQQKRLNGLLVQQRGAAALLDPMIAKAMGLNEETIGKLEKVNQDNMAARREAMQGLQGASREEMMEAFAKQNEKANAALLAALNDEQKKKMEDMKGAKLEMDLAPLRPRRPNQ